MSKPVNQWVKDIEAQKEAEEATRGVTAEVIDSRALFSRLIEYSGNSVGEKMQTLAKTGEVNTYHQVSRAPQQQQEEMGMERE